MACSTWLNPNEADSVIGIETVFARASRLFVDVNPNEADSVIGIETLDQDQLRPNDQLSK